MSKLFEKNRTKPTLSAGCVVGVDVGGTFTDLVLVNRSSGEVSVVKKLNRHEDRSETVVEGLDDLLRDARLSADDIESISHGTTITTNAVLERRGAKTALITNRHFRDILEIGKFARPARMIYRVNEDRPVPLVPRHLRLGVTCRIDRDGEVVTGLDEEDLRRAIEVLAAEQVESVAVCFLFSFLNPKHEEEVKDRIAAALPDLDVVLSSDILREFREFPRTATTVFAAYVAPILQTYIGRLLGRLKVRGISRPIYIFQSNGGVARPEIVLRNPAHTLLSGPAGAVVGATALCKELGHPDFITMDMGGTSLDVCLVRGGTAEVSTSRVIDDYPVAVPMLDVHTIGAGGGSILRVDEVGRVKLGPDSMGARPGPACYGLGGDKATLTDVHLLMGLFDAAAFAGGTVPLDTEAARQVVRRQIADPLDLPIAAAVVGVYRIATNQIAAAIRTVAVESGSDLRDFVLVAFGGGGPLHAVAVAHELGIRHVIVPRHPGLFSAWGIATADFSHDYVQSIVRPISEITLEDLMKAVSVLGQRASEDLDAERIAADRRELAPAVDLRYLGQATEITVPLSQTAADGFDVIVEQFHQMHKRLYSYSVPGEPVELVNVRLRAIGRVESPPQRPGAGVAMEEFDSGMRREVLDPESAENRVVPVYRRHSLTAGASFIGPLIIEEPSSTTIVLSETQVSLDSHENIVIKLPNRG